MKWIEKKGLLYREYETRKKERGKTYSQLIAPVNFRHIVMTYAHKSIMSGHLAIQKTNSRILSKFFIQVCCTMSNGFVNLVIPVRGPCRKER